MITVAVARGYLSFKALILKCTDFYSEKVYFEMYLSGFEALT